MMFRLPSRNIAFVLALAIAWSGALPAAAANLPRLEADALGGNHVVLPTDAAGKPLVLLLAFTKEAEADLKSWSRKLLDDRVARDAVVPGAASSIPARACYDAPAGLTRPVHWERHPLLRWVALLL